MDISQGLTAGELIELLSSLPTNSRVMLIDKAGKFYSPALLVWPDKFVAMDICGHTIFDAADAVVEGNWSTGSPFEGVLILPSPPEVE